MEEYVGLLEYIIKNKQTNDNNKKQITLKLFPVKTLFKNTSFRLPDWSP